MRGFVFGLAVALIGVNVPWQGTSSAFDPVGQWKVSTQADDGRPMSVNVEIAGKPGAYTGKALTSEGRELPLNDLATTPTGVIAAFALPQGEIIVSFSRDASGKFVGAWGAVEQTFALTAERVKQ